MPQGGNPRINSEIPRRDRGTETAHQVTNSLKQDFQPTFLRTEQDVSKARIGTFDDLLQITEESLRPIVKALQALVFEIDPDACEVVRLGDRAATYGVGPRKMIDGYAYILPYRKWVNLGFYQGVDLADPESLLEGTGAKMRHVKVRSLEAAGRSAVRALIESALAERTKTRRC